VDRDDVIGALDAFHRGSERRIDLALVNGRVFVNNASIGFYGKVVQSPEYRDAKLRTVIEMLPDLLGPGAAPFDLRFTDPGGAEYETAQLLLVSNNRYELDPLGGQGTRGTMNDGTLGVVVVPDGPPLRRWREWTTFRFEVDSGATIDVGLDGEASRLEPPLRFESLPEALRIRTPAGRRHPGPPPLRRKSSS
jgi:diacylglycerol kinase family enzyme